MSADVPGAGQPAEGSPDERGLGALACDGTGRGRPVPLTREALAGAPWVCVHLDRSDERHARWLREASGLDALACDALLEEETRPRLLSRQDGMLVILRGVNLNPGAEPDDMIALRAWYEPRRVITLRQRRLLAVQEVREALLAGRGPRGPGEMLVAIAGGLVDRQARVVDAMEEEVADVEEDLVGEGGYTLRSRIAEFRRKAIGLRRYIAPQREVLARLVVEPASWLDEHARARLREIAERQTRLVEEVDAARERAGVAQEELNGQLSERMNRNMYVLSLVAGVFLPLGLLTGLLGINVGGMPGVDSASGFWIVCALLLATTLLVLWLFRRIRLL